LIIGPDIDPQSWLGGVLLDLPLKDRLLSSGGELVAAHINCGLRESERDNRHDGGTDSGGGCDPGHDDFGTHSCRLTEMSSCSGSTVVKSLHVRGG